MNKFLLEYYNPDNLSSYVGVVKIKTTKTMKETVLNYFDLKGYDSKKALLLAKDFWTHKYEYASFINNEEYAAIIITNEDTDRTSCFVCPKYDLEPKIRILPTDTQIIKLAKKIANICEICPSNPLHATFEDRNFKYHTLDGERKTTEERKDKIGKKMYAYIMEVLDEYDSLDEKTMYLVCEQYDREFDYILRKRDLLLSQLYHTHGWGITVDEAGNIFHSYTKKFNHVQVF